MVIATLKALSFIRKISLINDLNIYGLKLIIINMALSIYALVKRKIRPAYPIPFSPSQQRTDAQVSNLQTTLKVKLLLISTGNTTTFRPFDSKESCVTHSHH
ncbi:hypothetical protein CCP3SC1_1230005 [Gammaproteobacteria bacterium]